MHEQPIRILAYDDKAEMTRAFHASIRLLRPAMQLQVRNAMAEIQDPVIDDVSIRGEQVEISYSADWSVYSGCDDYREDGELLGCITGELVDGYWVFPRYVPPPQRTTHEEF